MKKRRSIGYSSNDVARDQVEVSRRDRLGSDPFSYSGTTSLTSTTQMYHVLVQISCFGVDAHLEYSLDSETVKPPSLG